MWPDSNPEVDTTIMWIEFVVGSLTCFKNFFPQALRFSPLHKNQHFQIPIRPGMADKEPPCGCATAELLFTYLFRIKNKREKNI